MDGDRDDGGGVIAISDGNLTPGASYHYRVFATGQGQDSSSSNVVLVTLAASSGEETPTPDDLPADPEGRPERSPGSDLERECHDWLRSEDARRRRRRTYFGRSSWTSRHRKQFATWSLTRPQACMNA